MRYHVFFSYQNGGVSAHHLTLEAAQSHVNMLMEMNPGNVFWEIVHDGKEIRSSKYKIK